MKTLHCLPLLFAGFLFGFSADADELITLKTRPEVTQSMLLWEPYSPSPDIVIVLFPGGAGNVGLGLKDGRAEAARPYLFSRQRELFAQPQFAVAVIDTPSDQKGMEEEFRQSANHFADMEAVARELRGRFPKARIVLMAHSRGTVSAGYVARALGDRVGAIVLFSGRYHVTPRAPDAPPGGPGGSGLSGLDLGSLKSSVLLVHHAKDACPATPFAQAEALSARIPTIRANGSDEASSGPPCGLGTNHWFVGMEKAVGEEVVKWLSGKSWQRAVP
jgi:pimeloyl-ACP methyl ester carboxylesterase